MSGHANCPNCAWAIEAAANLKLPPLESWLLAIVAENVSRFTLAWTGSAAKLAKLTRMSERKIRYILAAAVDPDDNKRSKLCEAISIHPRKGIGLTIRLRRVSERETAPAQDAEVAPAQHAEAEPLTPAQRAETPAPRAVATPAHRAENPLKKESPLESPKEVAPLAPHGGPKATRTALSDDWQPGPKGVAFAEQHGVDPVTEVPRFVAHHQAKGNRMVWEAAWRTWCLNDEKWRRPGLPLGERTHRPSAIELRNEQDAQRREMRRQIDERLLQERAA